MNSLIQNNQNLYVAFIDLKKCFDFVDREMMYISFCCMILMVNCTTRSKTFTKVQNLVYEFMENSQIGLVVKQVLNRETIYPRLYFQFL